MKYRSYNSEILIGTTLVVNVFNDIIIDRRTHGLSRDYSKPITLSEIVQQKIEVPCILGDKGLILKSLENEPGKYRMPLIIMQMKGIKTDVNRMVDLHADMFYQQDDSFAKLDINNPKYKQVELSKMRGQPVNLTYEVTFLTKYREDLDQILSNFAVHFRPDIYLKWWHPRKKVKPINSQLVWDHSLSYDSNVDYDPQKTFMYKSTSNFTLKTWLFYGMHALDNMIDPDTESIIEHFHIFPTIADTLSGEYDNSDVWVIGDIMNTPDGVQTIPKEKAGFGFYGVATDQEFVSDPDTKLEKLKTGKYAVDNVFNELLFDEPGIKEVKTNQDGADLMTTAEVKGKIDYNLYQDCLELDTFNKVGLSHFKNVYFKGSFPESAFFEESPSGDFVFRQFFKSYVNNKKAGVVFGDTFNAKGDFNINYDIGTKDLVIWSNYEDDAVKLYGKVKYNSKNGHFQEVSIESKPINDSLASKKIKYSLHKEFDAEFFCDESKTFEEKMNMIPLADYNAAYSTKLLIEDTDTKGTALKTIQFVKAFWNSIDLQEKKTGVFEMTSEDPMFGEVLKKKKLEKVEFRKFIMLTEAKKDDFSYQILCNKWLYLVLKTNLKDDSDIEIYDIGAHIPMKFFTKSALIYEVTIPESRELLGLNFRIGL